MENNAIVGFTGFVGSNLLQFYKFNHFYNSKNFHEAKNKEFDTLFFSGVPAVKWKANKNPEEDNSIIEELKNILDTISVKKIILISTIDVYENTNNGLNEDYHINYNKNHTYGKNRFLFEEYIKTRYINYNIIRLPALFGKGLKKNLIYDLINNNNVNDIPINSSFQWYYLDWLKNDIDIILKNDIKICNLFTEPIDTINIIKIFKKIYGIDYGFQIEYFGKDTPKINYNTCTKYKMLFNNDKEYIRNNGEIMKALEEYLNFEKMDKSRLCVSNICVNDISQIQFAGLLKLYGITKVQIAPTKLIGNWDNLSNINFDIFTNNNLEIYAFQSILYGLDNLNIFDEKTRNDLFIRLTKIIDLAEDKGVKILVFGCPKNRKILDDKQDNVSIFVDFFQNLGNYCQGKNIIICLENNSKKYNCNFINTIDECASIVRGINKKNVKMMVDLGNAVMERDDWYYLKKQMDILYNIDISHENMADFSNIHESNDIFKFVLKNNKYDKIINLEMLIRGKNELDILRVSLNNFISIYN
jgi:sugar phosphate isomerase/epimerase